MGYIDSHILIYRYIYPKIIIIIDRVNKYIFINVFMNNNIFSFFKIFTDIYIYINSIHKITMLYIYIWQAMGINPDMIYGNVMGCRSNNLDTWGHNYPLVIYMERSTHF